MALEPVAPATEEPVAPSVEAPVDAPAVAAPAAVDDMPEIMRGKDTEQISIDMNNALKRGDKEAVEIYDKWFKAQEDKKAGKTEEKPAEPAAPAAAETPQQTIKKFQIRRPDGTTHEEDDPDGLLGMGNTGKLKRNYIQKRMEAEELRRQLANKEAEIQAKVQEELRKLSAAAPASPAPAPSVPPARIARPKYPEPPKLSSYDPADMTPADIEADKNYRTVVLPAYYAERDKYDEQLERMRAELPPEIQQKLSKFEEVNARLEAQVAKAEEEKRARLVEIEQENFWKDVNSLQKSIGINLSGTIQDLHHKAGRWMDELAEAHGIVKPPEGTADFAKYDSTRAVLAQQILDKDPKSLELMKSAEITLPEDVETYFRKVAPKVIEVRNYRDKVASDLGVAPSKLSLKRALMLRLDETGELDETLNTLRTEERLKGVSSVTDAIKSAAASGKTVPPSIAQSSQIGLPNGVTKEDVAWAVEIANFGPERLTRLSPSDRKRYERVLIAAGGKP